MRTGNDAASMPKGKQVTPVPVNAKSASMTAKNPNKSGKSK